MENTEERVKKYHKAIKPVVEDLKRIGLVINKNDFTHLQAKSGVIVPLKTFGIEQQAEDLQYLSKKYKPLPKEAIDILIKWIPVIENETALVILIGQLSGTKVRYDGNVLLKIFKKIDSSLIRERIGFVLEETKPDIDLQELENILLDPVYGADKSTLILAGVKHLPKEKINPILLSEFDKNFLIVLKVLAKTGGQKELEFLKTQLTKDNIDKKQKKEIEKVIEKIEKRLGKE